MIFGVLTVGGLQGSTFIIQEFWGINQTTGNLEPLPQFFPKTVRVFDLIVQSPGSIVIGGFNASGFPFATITASETEIPTVNTSRISIIISRDILVNVVVPVNGSTFMSNFNLDLNPNSNAVTAASDADGNGFILMKWNRNHEQPYLNLLGSAFGNVEILTNPIDNFTPTTGPNNISFGFYRNLTVTPTTDIQAFNGRDYSLTMNKTRVRLLKSTHVGRELYFNQTYNGNASAPPTIIGKMAMFGRDDNNIYVKRDNGQIKRISLVGSGSQVFSDEVKINNNTYFYGNVYFENDNYKAIGNTYACLDNRGRLFSSPQPCHLTTSTWTNANISDPSMGTIN